MARNGGRFDFDDGGTYCGSWEEGRANGHGVCTGPDGKGEYAGAWHYGFEVSGVYTWPSGSTYAGQWQNGRRHGLGVEARGRWIYRGEWTQGQRGRYGKREVISPSTNTITANYMGTWTAGFNDGYGTETYPDGGTYIGQWQRSMRHGYGVRTSAPYANALRQRPKSSERNASLSSLRSVYDDETTLNKAPAKPENESVDGRAGFVLRARSDAPARRRRSLSERSLAMKRSILSNLRIKKQHSTGDIHQRVTSMSGSLRSSGSLMSCTSDESESPHHGHAVLAEPPEEQVEPGVVELYKGEWKNDQRSGFGICERSDGLKYIGEWAENRKNGYGITYFKDGTKEEGRYKNNVLVSSTRRKALIFVRASRMREKIENSVEAAHRAASIATQKADIATSRTQTAQERAEAAEEMSKRAKGDADVARITASQFDPTFVQPGVQVLRRNRERGMLNHIGAVHGNHVSFDSTLSSTAAGPQPTTSAFGTRMTHSYQQLPMGNHRSASSAPHTILTGQGGAAVPMIGNAIAGSIDPLNNQSQSHDIADDYSRSFDYSQAMPSTSINSGHVTEQAQYQYSQNPQQQDLARYGGAVDRPSLHTTASNATNPTIYDDVRINEGASTSTSPRPGDYSGLSASPQTASSSLHRRPDRGSILSISDDHYEQYTMARSGNSASVDVPSLRRNRPSLTRQSDVASDALGQNFLPINRRSTLASAQDRTSLAASHRSTVGNPLGALGDKSAEERGSLPNLVELEGTGLKLRREDAARLASQRRQEAQRLAEEEELLRANPLRYIFHPALRNWVNKWKIPLLLAVTNFILLYVLFRLLTFERSGSGGKATGSKHGSTKPSGEL